MKLLKPTWVHHDDKPIFSVDVHQECLKFATGGQGMDSGRVVIWNLLPVLSEKIEQDESVPKMLCQIDSHLACVNCVRWSTNGQMLASGSDDKLVMIWRMAKGASGVFGTGGIQKNAESWKCSATLRGHSGDVLDLAWSPQDRWLASCSIDNTIIVWDVQAFPAMVTMLRGHSGLVKGVAWDPVGKFLASQSDDRSVKIWKTSDWTCNSTITEPFDECGGTTHILRLSWSPDGQYLVSAHAMNGGGPTAQIIEREGWKCDKDFVGHRKAVTCVRFHDAILARQTPKSNKPQQYCCLAMGSRDRSLSVWMTALQRPLVVIHDLFNDSILDLSWGPSKCILMACSGDGTVACLQFSENELGTPLTEDEKNLLYQRIYGKNVTISNGSSGMADLLIENPELLFAQEKPKPPMLPTVGLGAANFSVPTSTNGFTIPLATPTSGSNGMQSLSKQLETRTADGKRRITPVFVPLNQENNESIATCNISQPAESTVAPKVVGTEEESTFSFAKPIITEVEEIRLDARLVKTTTTSRVQPILVDTNAVKSFPLIAMEKPPSSTSNSSTSSSSPTILPAKAYQASTTGPKLTINANTKCEFQKTALDHRVHVHNGFITTATGLLAKVTAYSVKPGKIEKLWELLVGSPIINLNFCLKYVLLCSLDGTLRLLHLPTGRAMLPILSLTTAAVQCAFSPSGKLVGVVTDSGILRIWNVEESRIVLATTCNDILGKFGTVAQFNITENGMPLLLITNGHSYSYSKQLQTWLVLNTKDPIMRHGLQTTMPREFQMNYLSYPLISTQASMNTFAAMGTAVDMNAHDWQSNGKLSFIENQIMLCEAIESPDELIYWYGVFAYHLALSGTEKRLRLLLDDLLGTSSCNMNFDHKILSIPKHKLMATVLNVLKSHAKWQRIYMEYNELFESSPKVDTSKKMEIDGDINAESLEKNKDSTV